MEYFTEVERVQVVKGCHNNLSLNLIKLLESKMYKSLDRVRALEIGFGDCSVYKDVLKKRFQLVTLVERNSNSYHTAIKMQDHDK